RTVNSPICPTPTSGTRSTMGYLPVFRDLRDPVDSPTSMRQGCNTGTERAARSDAPARDPLHAGDQAVEAFVVGAERILAQDRTLRLVVELEVDPVDGEVAAAFLGVPDELAAQPGPGGLRRRLLGLEYLHVGGHPVDRAALLQQRVQSPTP